MPPELTSPELPPELPPGNAVDVVPLAAEPDEAPESLPCSVESPDGDAGWDAAGAGAEATSFFLPPHPWEIRSAAVTPIREKALFIIQVSVKFSPAKQSTMRKMHTSLRNRHNQHYWLRSRDCLQLVQVSVAGSR